jgi:hypothetical protein
MKGYAVISFGVIEIATVSPTRRGALVNWLVTTARRPIYSWTTDAEIERHWRECKGSDHEAIEVDIAPSRKATTNE